jgi:hypothetical protein
LTIFINEQEVNFTLEGDEKAYDIYRSIISFLKDSNHLIYSFSIDGVETDPENVKLWKDQKASDIQKIEVTALTEKEYLLTGLLTVAEYINLLLRSVSENSQNTLNELMKEYPSIIKNIPVLVKGNRGEIIRDHLNKIVSKSGLLTGVMNEEYKEKFFSEISNISDLINSAAREIEDPRSELKASIEVMEKLIPQLNEVSILLQTGKDQQAMGLIITLTELLQKILRIISIFNTDNIKINDGNYDSFSVQLNSILNELAEAFDAKDSVLIGDLLEYEITPKLEILSKVVKSMKELEEE